LASLGLAALAAVGLGAAAVRLAGIDALYSNHVIATLEFEGLASPGEVEDLREALSLAPDMRGVELVRSPGGEGAWLARVQFHARSAAEGRRRIAGWTEEYASSHPARLVRGTYFRFRVARPRSGDLVIGRREVIRVM
jgi:hypothetical protein